jgi:hypothetical protein
MAKPAKPAAPRKRRAKPQSLVTLLLDRSGSMGENEKWPRALAAVNAYVHGIAKEKVDTGVTMAVFDSNQNPFQGYRSHFKWEAGICVRDWRFGVRLCNIDTTITSNNISADLIGLMSRAIDRLPSLTAGRCAFYMNRTIFSILKIQALAKSNYALSVEEGLTQIEYKFLGIPLRKVDQILNTEATIS